jgi:hypothetical protein
MAFAVHREHLAAAQHGVCRFYVVVASATDSLRQVRAELLKSTWCAGSNGGEARCRYSETNCSSPLPGGG